MRIIGGEARGRRLFTLEGNDTRPTPDRVRESLFNILSRDLPGALVLDLFAGSGAMALEAISRGAASAVLCDHSAAAGKIIRKNIELLRADAKCTYIQADYKAALKWPGIGPFTLVFLDPPYNQPALYTQALEQLIGRSLLAPGARVLIEYEKNRPEIPESFEIADERGYGRTKVAFLEPKE